MGFIKSWLAKHNVANRFGWPAGGRVLVFGPFTSRPLPDLGGLLKGVAFLETFHRGSQLIDGCRGWSPWKVCVQRQMPADLSDGEFHHMTEMLLQLSLYALVSDSQQPFDAVAGISLGEYAAAYAAGVVTFEEVIQISCEAYQASRTSVGGDLLAVRATVDQVRGAVGDLPARLLIDGTSASVWAAFDDDMPVVVARLREAAFDVNPLQLGCMPHTSFVDRAGLERAISGLPARAPRLPFYSSYRGGQMTGEVTPAFWGGWVSEPVNYDGMIDALLTHNYTEFLWIGRERMLQPEIRSKAASMGKPVEIISYLQMLENRPGMQRQYHAANQYGWHRPRGRRSQARTIEPVSTIHGSFSEAVQNPYAYYRRWRKLGPIHYFPAHNGWLLLNYDDVAAVAKQPDLYSSAPQITFDRQLSGADAPDHTRVRRMLAPHFTKVHLPERSERIRKLSAEFILPLRDRGSFEIMSDLAQPLTHAITCDWLGIDPLPAARIQPDGPLPAWDELLGMINREGMFRILLDDKTIDQPDLLELIPFLLKAGVTTVRDFIGLATYSLLRHPEMTDQARADPAIIPGLVEELLRYESPVITLMRRTRTALTLAGQALPADSLIYASIGAANRDPEKFDRPDELVLNRPVPRIMSFSIGPHHCLGALFGRHECEIILTSLLLELPPFKNLIPLDQVEFHKLGLVLRALKSLPLGFVRST